ncbi:hypothetical protein B8W69_16145 [Mycobacterium vulneris]|uniref:Uncharacterized protein n=1 Tax=Mycolicibacterium vulneris TaxID=547163 RepID=A0A1X2KYA5_9MYCO|nr:hypothetical protein B8W69_16145 [Mycolicibacterium vulneris]
MWVRIALTTARGSAGSPFRLYAWSQAMIGSFSGIGPSPESVQFGAKGISFGAGSVALRPKLGALSAQAANLTVYGIG